MRSGNFSSSEIHKLMSKGRGAFTIENVGSSFNTYVQEKKFEQRHKRSLSNRINTKPIVWGQVMEGYVFENLPLEYKEMNEFGRLFHKDINHWCGIPDVIRKDVVSDIKCPSSLLIYSKLIDSFENGLEAFKTSHKEYYWQLVSNAILTNVSKGELIVFMPKKSELTKVQTYVRGLDVEKLEADKGITPYQFNFIDTEIEAFLLENIKPSYVPYLKDESDYKSLTKFEFDIPKEDMDALTERVKLAVKELR